MILRSKLLLLVLCLGGGVGGRDGMSPDLFISALSPPQIISSSKNTIRHPSSSSQQRQSLVVLSETLSAISSSLVEQQMKKNAILGGNVDQQELWLTRRKKVTTTTTTFSPKNETGTAVAVSENPNVLSKKRRRATTAAAAPVSRVTKTSVQARPYKSAIEVLRIYHSIHGDLVIPRRYTVPESKEYPKEWHGIDIASTFYDMRWWLMHVRDHPTRVSELNTLGFVWGRLQPEWNNVIEALMTYKVLHNNSVMVPSSFVVPYGNDTWPKSTWGIPLGNCVYRIRARHDFLQGDEYASRKAQLDGLEFVWDVSEHLFQKVYAALCHFAKLERQKVHHSSSSLSSSSPSRMMHNSYHHPPSPPPRQRQHYHQKKALRIPSNFVVPSGTEHGWPAELWGFPLGAKCSAIRHKGLYDVKNDLHRRRALEEIGFQWSGNATLGWLEVVHAAAIYSRLNGRNLDVPLKFVVPAPPRRESGGGGGRNGENVGTGGGGGGLMFDDFGDDTWPWPENLWGLPLGQRLKDVRLKGAYLNGSFANDRRAQLDALGFVWTPKRGRKPKPVVS